MRAIRIDGSFAALAVVQHVDFAVPVQVHACCDL